MKIKTKCYIIALGLSTLLFIVALAGRGMVENALLFHPTNVVYNTLKDFNVNYEEITLKTPSGLNLNAWYVPAQDDYSVTILFLSGNGGNMSMMSVIDRLRCFHQLGFSSLVIDYPGYGQSRGKPSETGTYQAAEAAWRYLTFDKNIKPANVVIYGMSLGGGVASWLARKYQAGGLILDSTFTKLADAAETYFPASLVWFVVGHDYDTESRLRDIHSPLLLLHSREDEIVPYELGARLYEGYKNGPKRMITGRGRHVDFKTNYDLYSTSIKEFIERLTGADSNER